MPSALARLAMLRLGSAALPIGAFAYSQGLESAVERGWVRCAADAEHWIGGILRHSVLTADVPLLVDMYEAWCRRDTAAIAHLTAQWRAYRATRELRNEDRQLGIALLRMLARQNIDAAAEHMNQVRPTLGGAWSLAGAAWGLSAAELAACYCFAWCEAQVGAAIRLVPLGQFEAQNVLSHLLTSAAGVLDRDPDALSTAIHSTVPGQALCCAWHESLYSRLFRS